MHKCRGGSVWTWQGLAQLHFGQFHFGPQVITVFNLNLEWHHAAVLIPLYLRLRLQGETAEQGREGGRIIRWSEWSPWLTCQNLRPTVIVLEGQDLGRWLGPEGGGIMNGISVLAKETPQNSPVLSTIWGYKEKSCHWKGALSRPCQHHHLGHPASGTVVNKWFLYVCIYKPPSLR